MNTVSPGRQSWPTAMMRVPGSPSSGEIARLGLPPDANVTVAVAVGVRSPPARKGNHESKLARSTDQRGHHRDQEQVASRQPPP